MWTPLITLYALVLLAGIAGSYYVGLTSPDSGRAGRANSILKRLLAASFGSTGLFTVLLRLHEAGLL